MSSTLEVAIEGIGLCAPGLPDWPRAREVLAGAGLYRDEAMPRAAPSILSPNERRRAPESVLLALEVAQAACAMAGREAHALPNVFASSYGDLPINHYLCAILAQSPGELSPTKFHNSVHNAAAGYWTIATGCMATSNAISASSATFAVGLLEAALLAVTEATPVLCVAYDVAAIGPLADVVACTAPFGVAFVIAPATHAATARLRLSLRSGAVAEAALDDPALHALRASNPAAHSLPLLIALARAGAHELDYRLPARDDAHAAHLHLEISL